MAAYLEWHDGYRVGIAQFDEEHKALLDRINRIATAKAGRHELSRVGGVLSTLVDDMLHDFDHEELVMETTYYPELERHRGSHNRLLRNLMRHVRMCREGEISLADFGTYFFDWLLEHIVQEDMKFGDYLRHRGVR